MVEFSLRKGGSGYAIIQHSSNVFTSVDDTSIINTPVSNISSGYIAPDDISAFNEASTISVQKNPFIKELEDNNYFLKR